MKKKTIWTAPTAQAHILSHKQGRPKPNWAFFGPMEKELLTLHVHKM
jgi:hypothetical protein